MNSSKSSNVSHASNALVKLNSYNNTHYVPETSGSKSILPDSKTPNVKLKWKEKDYNKKENEMEAAERRLTEDWDPGQNLEVLPQDQKEKQKNKNHEL